MARRTITERLSSAINKKAGRAVDVTKRGLGRLWGAVTGMFGENPSDRDIERAVDRVLTGNDRALPEEPGVGPSSNRPRPQTRPRSRPPGPVPSDPGMSDDDIVPPEDIGITYMAPQSTNVYSYRYDHLNETLYVTYRVYKKIEKGSDQRPNQPGVTYAYYGVPRLAWVAFRKDAQADQRGGEEVWDDLRIRGSIHGTQYSYAAVGAQEADGETYVPRRATARGLRKRAIIDRTLSTRENPIWDESNLPDQIFSTRRRRRNNP